MEALGSSGAQEFGGLDSMNCIEPQVSIRCKLPQRGLEPQRKANLVHFSLKICHLVASGNFTNFPEN